jgi:hypothetical protein
MASIGFWKMVMRSAERFAGFATLGQRDALVVAEQVVLAVDPLEVQDLVGGEVLDDDLYVVELGQELLRQGADRLTHQFFEVATVHASPGMGGPRGGAPERGDHNRRRRFPPSPSRSFVARRAPFTGKRPSLAVDRKVAGHDTEHRRPSMSVDIQPLPSSDAPEAARTLARAFVTNPLNQAAFGRDALARNEAFFRLGLSVMRGENFAAMEGSRILGVVHWVEAPACDFSPGQKLGMLPAMIRSPGWLRAEAQEVARRRESCTRSNATCTWGPSACRPRRRGATSGTT